MGRRASASLTWRESEGRWRKKYQGRYFYFPAGAGNKTKSESAAKAAFKEWKLAVDNELAQENESQAGICGLIEQEQQRLLREFPDTDFTRLHYQSLAQLLEYYSSKIRSEGESVEDFVEAAGTIARLSETFKQFPRGLTLSGPRPAPEGAAARQRVTVTIQDPLPPPGIPPWELDTKQAKPGHLSELIAKFLESMGSSVSLGRVEKLRVATSKLLASLGDMRVSEIGSPHLLEYQSQVKRQVDQGKLAAVTGRDHLAAVRQLFRWAYRIELIDNVPRVLATNWTVEVTVNEVAPAEVTAIKSLLKEASDRERLYALLALNCGYGPADISKLKQAEIDWKAGTITRKRSKTGKLRNAPVVCYQLWRETFRLLRQFRSNDPELALLTVKGTPLVVERQRPDGSLLRSDSIHSAWVRLARKADTKTQLKQLRKSGATLLANHPEYSRWTGHYLGHAAATVADRHYVKKDQQQFAEALKWLGQQFGIK